MGDGWDDIFLLELHVLCDYAVLLYYFSENCRFQETIFWRAGNAFYGVGLLFITGSAIFPSLPGYTQPHMLSGVEGGFYIDMIPFMAGLVLVLFGRILRYGFEYQKEMDSIL